MNKFAVRLTAKAQYEAFYSIESSEALSAQDKEEIARQVSDYADGSDFELDPDVFDHYSPEVFGGEYLDATAPANFMVERDDAGALRVVQNEHQAPVERDYTVILQYPSYLCDGSDSETWMETVKGESPLKAQVSAQKQLASDCSDGERDDHYEDFCVIAVIEGSHADIRDA